MEELIQLLDKHLVYDSHELMDNKLAIHVSSNRITATCPYCRQPFSRMHSLYTRNFQDLPIQGNKVIIYLLNRRFFCVNSDCTHKTFPERFDCIFDKAKKTKRLEQEILTIAIHCSSVTASKILNKTRQISVKVPSAICSIRSTLGVPLTDASTCYIDDFAIKKRHHYGTVLADQLSHRIIDLIDSRNIPEVSEGLKSDPGITVISRDGSSSYKRAISDTHPNAVQMSDRFHLIQNLTDRIKQYLMSHLPINVSVKDFIESDKPFLHLTKGEENRQLLFEEKIRRTQALIQNGWRKMEICQELNMNPRSYDKITQESYATTISKAEKNI